MTRKAHATGGVTFGEGPTFSSEKKIAYHLEDDKQAFEIRFDTTLAAGVGTAIFDGVPKTDAPVSTRIYSAVIPATGKNVKTSFVVNGFGATEAGTNTVLMLSVNDQHSVTHFAPNRKDQAFLAALPYRAKTVTDVRLTVVLVAERDSTHPDGSALIAITDISADAAFTGKKPAKRGKKKSKAKKK
jgi:hypothetical protein